MTAYAEQTEIAPVVLPPSPTRPEPAPAPADHVRVHGRECWWNVAECRWECRRV